MSILAPLVQSLVQRVKRDPSYRMAAELGDRQLATVLWHRGRQYLRGIPLRLRARGVHGATFRGRRVVVEHAYAFSSGPGLILDDGVLVHALSRNGIAVGRNVTIARGATLTCTGVIAEVGEGISIGDRSAVGAGSFLGGQGGIRVGNDVIMGPGVRIFSENHNHDDTNVPIRAQGQSRAAVTIEDDCWLGAGVLILAGVTIGRGSVIAAGAVVTHGVPEYSVAGGVPARVLKSRRPAEAVPPDLVGLPVPEPLAPWPRAAHALQADR
jgi:acetyltransferase-like isoleucine patch superfamily enzyme